MIVCPPIVIVYISSYYGVNVIHANDTWTFIVLILDIFINHRYRLNIEMDTSTIHPKGD